MSQLSPPKARSAPPPSRSLPPPTTTGPKATAPAATLQTNSVSSLVKRLRRGRPEKSPGDKLFIYGPPGLGKTTAAGYAPDPVFLVPPDDHGIVKLLELGLVPEDVAYVEVQSWEDTLSLLREIAAGDEFQTVVLDNLRGFEELCRNAVCKSQFESEWKKFESYGKGNRAVGRQWSHLLQALDAQSRAGKVTILLGHSEVEAFQNPLDENFDEWVPDLDRKNTWGPTHKWADAILFLNTVSMVSEGRGVAGSGRVIYTSLHDGYVAKNRYNMPTEIYLSSEPSENWPKIAVYLNKEKTTS